MRGGRDGSGGAGGGAAAVAAAIAEEAEEEAETEAVREGGAGEAGANAVRKGRLPWQRRPIWRPPMRKAKVGVPPPTDGAVKRALGKTSRDGPAARWPGRDEEARERWAEEEEEEERARGLRTGGRKQKGKVSVLRTGLGHVANQK